MCSDGDEMALRVRPPRSDGFDTSTSVALDLDMMFPSPSRYHYNRTARPLARTDFHAHGSREAVHPSGVR